MTDELDGPTARDFGMTGYDAATVEACAKVADAYCAQQLRFHHLYKATGAADAAVATSLLANQIRALPIAPPAPPVTADDAALIDERQTDAWNEFVFEHLESGNDGYRHADYYKLCRLAFDAARRAAPAVDETERLREALERIVKQDWWSAVDETDEIDGRCAEIARAALNREGNAG